MSDYISRETARALMLHKQDALTECDLDSIPAADVVPAGGYHRNVPLATLRKTPKATLINWLRFAESNESAALEVVHRQAREMAHMEVVQHGYWVYKHKVRGGIRELAASEDADAENVWRTGEPPEPGYYTCKVDCSLKYKVMYWDGDSWRTKKEGNINILNDMILAWVSVPEE